MRFGCTLSIVGYLRDPLLSMPVNSAKITMGLVGPGFVAPHHLDAVRRLGIVEIVGLAGFSLEISNCMMTWQSIPDWSEQ